MTTPSVIASPPEIWEILRAHAYGRAVMNQDQPSSVKSRAISCPGSTGASKHDLARAVEAEMGRLAHALSAHLRTLPEEGQVVPLER